MRSGIVPSCAKNIRLLGFTFILSSACLNPMPEEFPSNDELPDRASQPTPGTVEDSSGTPTSPAGANDGSSGNGYSAGGTSGTSPNGAPLPEQPPASIEGDEDAAPDAGTDAGALRTEDTSEGASTESGPTP